HANLEIAGAAQLDVPRDRQIERADETPLQIAVARLEADAPRHRTLERRCVELPQQIAAAPAPRIADDSDARAVVGGAGQVHIAPAGLITEADCVRLAWHRRIPFVHVRTDSLSGPDAGDLPVVHHVADRLPSRLRAVDIGKIPDEVRAEQMAERIVVA